MPEFNFSPEQPNLLSKGAGIFLLVFGALLGFVAMETKPEYALICLGGVLVLLLTLMPRIAFWLFLLSLSFYVPQRMGTFFALHPFDLLMGILFLAMGLDFLLRGKVAISAAVFDLPFLALIFATIVSGLFAYNPSYSVVPIIRIVVIYLAFRAFFRFGHELSVRKIITSYIYLITLLSLLNIILMLASAGKVRIFGPAGAGFETFAMTALPMALAFLIWSQSKKERYLYGVISLVIGLGIVATQSRAPLLAVIIVTPILIYFAVAKARRENDYGRVKTLQTILLLFTAFGILFFILSETLLAASLGRYESFIASMSKPGGTVALRLILWKNALRAFLDFPVTGIGTGNFRVVHQIYPDIQTIPLFILVKGKTAHNVILHYLAETGLVGAIALLTLALKGLLRSYRAFKTKLTAQDNQVSAALFIAMVVFCVTLLYMTAWTWGQNGYIMALLFGLTAAWHQQIKNKSTTD